MERRMIQIKEKVMKRRQGANLGHFYSKCLRVDSQLLCRQLRPTKPSDLGNEVGRDVHNGARKRKTTNSLLRLEEIPKFSEDM